MYASAIVNERFIAEPLPRERAAGKESNVPPALMLYATGRDAAERP